jgi:hypothetical protein
MGLVLIAHGLAKNTEENWMVNYKGHRLLYAVRRRIRVPLLFALVHANNTPSPTGGLDVRGHRQSGSIENINVRNPIINYRILARLGKVAPMATGTATESPNGWSRVLLVVGSIAMLVGALDPMEGSVVILPGSGLVVLGAFLGHGGRRLITFRVTVFALILIGVSAMFGLSWAGGFGGKSGRSMWWGVLVLPYLIGWSMGIWGPGSPRWLLLLGIVVGLWYVTLMGMILRHAAGRHGAMSALPGIVIGTLGVVTIGGCVTALVRRRTKCGSDAHNGLP